MLPKNKCIRFPGSPCLLDLTLHWLSCAIAKEGSHWEPCRWVWSHSLLRFPTADARFLWTPQEPQMSLSLNTGLGSLNSLQMKWCQRIMLQRNLWAVCSQQCCVTRPPVHSPILVAQPFPSEQGWSRHINIHSPLFLEKIAVNTSNSFKWHRFRVLNQFHWCQGICRVALLSRLWRREFFRHLYS